MNDERIDGVQVIKNVRGLQLDTDDSAALKLPPKLAIYNKLSKISVLSDVQKCFTKLR